MMAENERPKGLCQSPLPSSVMILVGKMKTTDSAFLSVQNESEYELKLSLTKLYPSGTYAETMRAI